MEDSPLPVREAYWQHGESTGQDSRALEQSGVGGAGWVWPALTRSHLP
jgi:hypothetical protein